MYYNKRALWGNVFHKLGKVKDEIEDYSVKFKNSVDFRLDRVFNE